MCAAQVSDLDLIVCVVLIHEAFGLEVAVHNPAGMHVCNGIEYLSEAVRSVALREHATYRNTSK
jgi:hypothetical protein